MNSYGSMDGTLRRVTAYQGVDCQHVPGHGADAFRIVVHEGDKQAGDVFYIYSESDLNRAINALYRRVTS
jgi:hypothetical protein